MNEVDAEIAGLKARIAEMRKAKRREYMREYMQKPEVKAKQREYMQKHRQKPGVKAKRREYMREYMQKPEVKLRVKLRAAGLSKEAIDAEINRMKSREAAQ